MDEKIVEEATKIYIKSSEVAMKETRNPSMAMQIATVVSMILVRLLEEDKKTQLEAQKWLIAMLKMVAQQAARDNQTKNSQKSKKNAQSCTGATGSEEKHD